MLVDLFDMRKTINVDKHGFSSFANEKFVKNNIGTIGIDGLKQLKGFVQVFGKSYLGLRIIDLQSVIRRRPPFATQQTAQERFFLPITIPSLKNSASRSILVPCSVWFVQASNMQTIGVQVNFFMPAALS
jgi:hypothetical protein